MSTPVPVLNRFFQIEIQDVPKGSPEVFYSIKGLNSATVQVKKVYLPGGFGLAYELPESSQGGTLVLKRPLLKERTEITKWCEKSLEKTAYDPRAAQVFVLNHSGDVVVHWSIQGAYPSRVETSSLGIDQGNGVIEEIITLGYTSLTRLK